MKVLMLGWEFPPFISGGLGTACHGLTGALSRLGARIIFVLPRAVQGTTAGGIQLIGPGGRVSIAAGNRGETRPFPNLRLLAVEARLFPYGRPASSSEPTRAGPVRKSARPRPAASLRAGESAYEGDLLARVHRYAELVCEVARDEDFDLVHAHDWMTFPAGIATARLKGKPLVVHVHSTEFDRSGQHVHQQVYDLERQGMAAADVVITVSGRMRDVIADRYGLPGERVRVVHNGIDLPLPPNANPAVADPRRAAHALQEVLTPIAPDPAVSHGSAPPRRDPIVLFLGRITMQKGPEYFLQAARKVLEATNGVRFVMAGWGDRATGCMALARELGIAEKVSFPGFLRGPEVDEMFRLADVYVMPSVSEPFGLVALEAISHGVPVILSKQSGVAEVLDSVLKVDFWDVDLMARMITAVLRRPGLRNHLQRSALQELAKLSWEEAARKCLDVYGEVLARRNGEVKSEK